MLASGFLVLTLACLPVSADDDVSKEVDVQILRLSDESSVFRERAARKLGNLGPRARLAVPHLVRAILDEDKDVRLAAAYGLAAMKKDGKPAASAVTKQLKKEKDPAVRANLCWALESFGNLKAARSALLKALSDDDASVVANAARALGSLGARDRGTVGALAKVTRKDSWTIRVSACWALAATGEHGKSAVPSLVRLLSDSREVVRAAAARALGAIAEDPGKSIDALLKALERELDRIDAGDKEEDPDKGGPDASLRGRLSELGGARRNMLWALGRFKATGKKAGTLLLRAKEKDPVREVRMAAQTAMDRADSGVLPGASEEKERAFERIPGTAWTIAVRGCIEIAIRHEQ